MTNMTHVTNYRNGLNNNTARNSITSRLTNKMPHQLLLCENESTQYNEFSFEGKRRRRNTFSKNEQSTKTWTRATADMN